VNEYEQLRQASQLAMGRAARYKGKDSVEWQAAARDFAYAKLMITLLKLAEEYPAMSAPQKREARKLIAA
jgi:hypothetical protein